MHLFLHNAGKILRKIISTNSENVKSIRNFQSNHENWEKN